MTPRIAPVVLALACIAGACSSSSDSAATTTPLPTTESTDAPETTPVTTEPAAATTAPPTTVPATTEAPATTEPPASTVPATTEPPVDELTPSELADQDLARSALLVLADFPDGWVEEPDEEDEPDATETDSFEAEFDACLGRDDDHRVGDDLERLTVSTGDFHPGDEDTTSVSHEVVLASDEPTAIVAMSEVAIDGSESCLAEVIHDFYIAEFAKEPELADIGVGEVTAVRTETDREPDVAVGVLLEIPLMIGDETVSQFLEILYQREGRALSELSMSSFGGPFSREGYAALSDEISLRLAAIGS